MDNGRPPRLSDLYVVGTHTIDEPIVFTTPRGEVKVHLVKLNDPDSEAVERRALAAKSRRLACLSDHSSDEYLAHYLSVQEVDDPNELVAFLVRDAMEKPSIEITAKLRSSGRWGEGDYYQGLEDAWYGDTSSEDPDAPLGLMYLWEQRPEQSDDPITQAENDERVKEAERVWGEILAFQGELAELLNDKKADLVEEFEDAEMEELRAKVIEVMVKVDAETHFYVERDMQRIFYATRELDDWRKRYFATRNEVDDLPDEVKNTLRESYKALVVGDLMGKELRPTRASSPPSESPHEEAPSRDSGLVGAGATRTSPTSS